MTASPPEADLTRSPRDGAEGPQPDFRSRSGLAFASLANDGQGRHCPLAPWSNELSTASVIAVTPVWMVGFGTGANSGEWLPGSGGPPFRAAATRSGS